MHRETDTVEILTIEEFMELPEEDGYRLELVRGHLVREPGPGPRHGLILVTLSRTLDSFARERGLGYTLGDAGFVLGLEPPTVRIPDISFVRRERVPPEGLSETFWRMAPDIAVEILSPSNSAGAIQEKVLEYLSAGACLVWVVDPKTESVTAYRPSGDIRLLRGNDVLDGEDVLPGFRLALPDLFSLD
jgi:Uma2 family endonuclease